MTYIAFDPGQTTGLAIHRTHVPCPHCHIGFFGSRLHTAFAECQSLNRCVDGFAPDQYVMAAIKNPTDLWDIIDAHRPEICIYENFQSAGLISKDGQHTIRLCGAIEVICFRENIKCIMHIPGERYGMMPAARAMLKQLQRPLISHEVDALAHLLLYEHRVSMGIADQIYANRRHPTEATV